MSPSSTRTAGRSDSPDPASHAATIYDTPFNHLTARSDEDDDDMDSEPSQVATDESATAETGFEESTTNAADDDDDDDDTALNFEDAEESLSDTGIEFSVEPAEGDAATTGATTRISPTQLLRLFNSTSLRLLLQQHGGPGLLSVDSPSEGGDGGYGRGARRGRKSTAPRLAVPNPEGNKLMQQSVFGRNELWHDKAMQRKKRVARRLMVRELGLDGYGARKDDEYISQALIPRTQADSIIHYNAKSYSGEFSRDGNFFFSCAQDFNVRMYDTSNIYDWKYYKTVSYPYGQWTITDATLSPDNRYLAYSSIRSAVCLASTDPSDGSEPFMLDFSPSGGSGRARSRYSSSHFGIWSVRFSGDGRELVAGTGADSVNVYDLETNKTILCIKGHNEDVNAVCYGDAASPHILYSGSDDTLLKVWDRRSLADQRAAGVFVGHTEGLTYVDSRGDGRYVLSNGKDQTMKLWDLRKLTSTADADKHDWTEYTTRFDYRFLGSAPQTYDPHPHDGSLVTFRGHSVMRTLIRCHFSPPGSTNSRYVFSGSSDGSVYIYNLDGTLAGKIDVQDATYDSRPRESYSYHYSYEMDDRDSWCTCVRDASWHPNAPMIAATAWNGWGGGTGTVTTHSWSEGADDDESETPVALRLNHKLEQDPSLHENENVRTTRAAAARARTRSRRIARAEADDYGEGW